VSLDDKVTTSGLVGQIEQCGSEACAGQIEINQSDKIFFRTVYYIEQQPMQLNSHLLSFLISVDMSCFTDSLCSTLTIGCGQILAHDLHDFKIHNCFRMISGGGLDGSILNHLFFFFFQRLKTQYRSCNNQVKTERIKY
jgi:hypothetical protein